MTGIDTARLAEVLHEHRWLTSFWRCACEPRDATHPVDAATFKWHAEHLAQQITQAGLLVDAPEAFQRHADDVAAAHGVRGHRYPRNATEAEQMRRLAASYRPAFNPDTIRGEVPDE